MIPGMSEERKKAGAGFWATVVVLGVVSLPFLYLAILGPEMYLCESGNISVETNYIVSYPYQVCIDYCDGEPHWFWESCEEYLSWWVYLAD